MKLLASILSLVAFVTPQSAQATEYSATVTITEVLSVVANRPAEPYSSTGFIRVYFPATTSIGSGCLNSAADIMNTAANSHMIKLIYLNRALNKPVTIWVDTVATRANNDVVCHATVVRDR